MGYRPRTGFRVTCSALALAFLAVFPVFENLVNQAIGLGRLGTHEIVTFGIQLDLFQWLAGMAGQDVVSKVYPTFV